MKSQSVSGDLVDHVYEQILVRLRGQGLLGSEPLSIASIARELGVSRTPINMAFVRLECDGLIRRLPARGWTTVEITLQDLEELYELRATLDSLLIRKATENASPEDLRELDQIVEDMEKAVEEEDVDLWLLVSDRYLSRLLTMAGSERLAHIQKYLRRQLIRMMVTDFLWSDRMLASTREHRQMVAAIAAGNPEVAVECALEHLSKLRANHVHTFRHILEPLRRLPT